MLVPEVTSSSRLGPVSRTRRALTFLALGALTVVGLVGACSSDGSTGPSVPVDDATVTLRSSSFAPSRILLNLGGTVTFNNSSGVTHNVTFLTAGSPSDILDHSSGSTARDFATEGEFNYRCTLHAGMTGRVTVVAPTP